MKQITELLDRQSRSNQWIRIDKHYLNVYIRVTDRYLNQELLPTLDIGTVQVDFRRQCQGNFTAFLGEIEDLAKEYSRHVYIESICRDFLIESLQKRGYVSMGHDSTSLAKKF